jgi:OOP family OmpA-OmpF porin
MTQKDCMVLGGVIGGGLLGAGGAAAVHNLDATPSDWERGAGAAGGAVTGILIGSLIGRRICEPAPEPAPVAAPPPPPGTEIVEIRGTHFAFDSAQLTSDGEAALDDGVAVLNRHTDITVTCDGHTDSIGSEEYNMKLGQARADAVRDYLVSQGISSDRVTARSFGESLPAADNGTDEGRAQNRRVEIIVQ